MSRLVIHGSRDIHPSACQELSDLVLESFNKQLDKYLSDARFYIQNKAPLKDFFIDDFILKTFTLKF